MRIVALYSLLSGAVISLALGHCRVAELPLLGSLMSLLAQGDILVGDRGFGCYVVLALLQSLKVDFVGRSARGVDGRKRRKRLGPNDWLITWQKGPRPSA